MCKICPSRQVLQFQNQQSLHRDSQILLCSPSSNLDELILSRGDKQELTISVIDKKEQFLSSSKLAPYFYSPSSSHQTDHQIGNIPRLGI